MNNQPALTTTNNVGNKTNSLPTRSGDPKPQGNIKILTQQVFHPGIFIRARSSSLTDVTTTNQNVNLGSNYNKEPENHQSADAHLGHEHPNPPPWQKVPVTHRHKRKRTEASPTHHVNSQSQNPFTKLPLDSEDILIDHSQQKLTSKPPPIRLYGIQDVNELSKLILTASDKNSFTIKIMNKNFLHILVKCAEEYKKIIDTLRAHGLFGYTFTPKDKKCYRIVIKNLHHTTPHSAIIEEVEKTGNKIRGEIINARIGPDKQPTTTFFVNLEPNINNKDVKKIEHIYYQKIKIEDPRKSKTIVQCKRCQQYGHSRNNCMMPFRCVKCGEGHNTSDCLKKDKNTPAKCALCLGDHPANYKGCQVYKEILDRKNKKIPQKTSKNKNDTSNANGDPPHRPSYQPSTYNDQQQSIPHPSYAQVTAGSHSNPDPGQTITLQNGQNDKMDQLLQQMSLLLGLITTLISKLVK